MPNITTRTIAGAAYWASYLINGDASGMEDSEIRDCDAWLARELEPNEEIVDCGEAYFSNSYGFHTGTQYRGGDLVDYTVLTRD
jgi:hypothetical protein